MDLQTAHMVFAKVACLLLMSALATACGVSVEDGAAADEDERTNRITAVASGAFNGQIESTEVDCERSGASGALIRLDQASPTPDDGAVLSLHVEGPLAEGDRVGGEGGDRHFSLLFVPPRGHPYQHTSWHGGPADVVMTVTKATLAELDLSLDAVSLAPSGSFVDDPADRVSLHGTFHCRDWTAD
jgi:hypothetical protein